MYYFVVTVLILQLFGKIKSEEFCPNVKVKLKGFPNLESVEYTINPISSEQEMPLPLLENDLYMTLISVGNLDFYSWWGLRLIKRVMIEKYNWERTFSLPMYFYNKYLPKKNYEFLNKNFTCLNKPMVVEYSLVVDENYPYLMNQYGCNFNRFNHTMDNNVIFLILFKDGLQFNLTNFNDTLRGYTQLLGILKIMNFSNEKNTDVENENVFQNYLENCQAISSNHNSVVVTNDYVYINENDATVVIDEDTSEKFNYLIPLMLFFLLCGIMIVKCLNHWICSTNVQN